MADTPETKVKKRLDRVMLKLAEQCNKPLFKDTFNIYARRGIPDCRYHFGYVPLYIEVKRDGKVPQPKQQYELDRLQEMGYIAFWLDNQGIDDLPNKLLPMLSEESIDNYVAQYREDARALRELLSDIRH